MRKKRGYQRDTPANLARDYKLFAIACEGAQREPTYFKLFGHLSSRIKVDVIEEVSDNESPNDQVNRSSPRWVLDRAASYVEKHGLIEEDELWLVIDVDRWERSILQEIASSCDAQTNWHLALSNPCFEVWLYFHLKADIGSSPASNCSKLKKAVSDLMLPAGYQAETIIVKLQDAIANAKAADSDPDHFFPANKQTKVYQLAEAVLKKVGLSSFKEFLENRLPKSKRQ
jgi:hypothetical protein